MILKALLLLCPTLLCLLLLGLLLYPPLLCQREISLLISVMLFWFLCGAGIYLKQMWTDGCNNVYYGRSRDIRDLRSWCWINYFLGVLLLFLYLYRLNWE